MKEVIEEVRKLLNDGVFSDEQHVRFSIVGRVCQRLGWDIWNPAEFYTEYPVKKYPPQEVTTELRGRVDVALFLADKRSDKAEVYIEVKNLGKLSYECASGEAQLQRYNYWDKAAICILTDGITWRFYLPSEGGAFDSTIFNEFNILNDNVDHICQVFEKVLRRDNFRKQALQAASAMYEELWKIKLIHSVRDKATQIAKETGMDKYEIAQRLLKQNEHVDLGLDEIITLWNKTIPNPLPPPPTPPPPPPPLPRDKVPIVIETKGVKASGFFDPLTNRVTLCKGSEIVKDHSISFDGGHLRDKMQMIQSGDLYLDSSNTKYILRQDKTFKSPSAASRLVLGRSSNGFTDWSDAEGNRLEVHRK